MMLTNTKFEFGNYPDSEGDLSGGGDVALQAHEGRVYLCCLSGGGYEGGSNFSNFCYGLGLERAYKFAYSMVERPPY
jgi:hypothetical protein